MAAPKKRNRSEYVAGLLVLCCGVLILFGTGMIAYFRNNPSGYQRYTMVFSLGSGIQGLQSGSPINYGGIRVGQVEGLMYVDGELNVKIAVDHALQLHPGVQIQRVGSLLGGQSTLVITNAGRTQEPPLGADARIQAAMQEGGLASVLGSENAMHLDKIQASLENAFVGLQQIGEQANDIGNEAGALAELGEQIQTDADRWQPKITNISENIESIQSKGSAIRNRFNAIVQTENAEGVEGTSRPGRVVVDAYKDINEKLSDGRWTKARENFIEIFEQAEEAKKQFETDVLPKVEKLVEKAEASWNNLLKTRASLERLATDAGYSLDSFIANSTLAAQQLALTQSEVLGALGLPLLERPSAEDEQLIVQAAALGDWTRAAFNLRESLQALEGITIKDDADAQATMARLVDTLRAALADYEDAQTRFFAPPKAPSSDK